MFLEAQDLIRSLLDMRDVEARMLLLNSSNPSAAAAIAGSHCQWLGHLHDNQDLPAVQIPSFRIVQLFKKVFARIFILHPLSGIVQIL